MIFCSCVIVLAPFSPSRGFRGLYLTVRLNASTYSFTVGTVGLISTAVSLAQTASQKPFAPESLLWALIYFLITLGAAYVAYLCESNAQFDSIRNMVEGHSDCINIGTVKEAAKQYRTRLQRASEVLNTFVVFNLSGNNPDIRSYLSETDREDLSNAPVWRDIFSEDSLAMNKFELREFVQKKLNNGKVNYDAFVLKRPYPIVNCTLIRYPGAEPSEVLFGGGFHPRDRRGDMFSSRNPKLYDLFYKYWQTLIDESVSLTAIDNSSNDDHYLTIHDLTGLWLSVAYPGKATGTIPKTSPLDIAFVLIKREPDRTITITVRRYKIDQFTYQDTLHSKAYELRRRNVWFIAETGGNVFSGFYNFVNRDEETQFPLLVDSFSGEFVIKSSSENSVYDIAVYGSKITGKDSFINDPQQEADLLRNYNEKVLSRWPEES